MEENYFNSEAVDETEKQTRAEFIKCTSCGSNMVFDPATQMLLCEHCGSTLSFEKNREVEEIAIEKAFDATEVWNETAVLRCENCGAQITVDRENVSLECPYCGTAHVRETEEIPGVKPGSVYPFVITKDEAVARSKKWAKSKLFAPRKFKNELDEKHLRGVYQPCFTFDSKTTSSYSGRLGKRCTRMVRTRNGVRTETYIKWYNVNGTFSQAFDDVTVSASSKIPQSKLRKLMPFDSNTICVYEKKYLAGFYANHYDKDIRQSWKDAKSQMDSQIRDSIRKKHNCDVVDYLNVSTNHSSVTYKYVLLPLYLLCYRYKKKNYEVTVNGNTGRVVGKSPVSFWRVLTAVVIGACVLTGLFFLYWRLGATDTASALLN